MKKIFLFILVLLSLKCFSQPATPTGYNFINAKYDWLEGKFRTLHVPSGGATQTLYGGWAGAGALYWDSIGKAMSVWDGASWQPIGGSPTLKTIDGNSILGTGNYITDYSMQVYTALGDTTKGQALGKSIADGPLSNTALTDGSARMVPIYIPQACTIYGFRWFQTTQGNYTSDNYNGAGLYSYSGGNLTLIASSTDDGNIWKASANTWVNKAFTTPVVISTPGIYFLLFVYNNSAQVQAPGIAAGSVTANAAVASYFFTNSAKLYGAVNVGASLPTPQAMSGIVAVTQVFYFSLY